MIRDLVVGMVFSAATNALQRAADYRAHHLAGETARWIYREEFGLAGSAMYRPISESDWDAIAEARGELRGVTRRCSCSVLKVSSWNGDCGHVRRADPFCQIHGGTGWSGA